MDAAIATLLCNGVVNPHSMGIGGGHIMTINLANGTKASLIAREMAPSMANISLFTNNINANATKKGPLAIAVPGEIFGYWEAKQRFGNPEIPWSDLFQPTIELCIGGILVSRSLARALKVKKEEVHQDEGLRSVFVNPSTGDVYKRGEFYKNIQLGRTLQRISENGWNEYYSGITARMLTEDIKNAGGLLTMEDLANYQVRWEHPIVSHIPGTKYRLVTSPPPGSGSLVSAILGISAGYQPDPVDKYRPLFWHRFLESCKYAFAMRSRLGDWSDPALSKDVTEVVGNLTSEGWWDEVRGKISDTETFNDPTHYGAEFQQIEDGGTSHISILSPAGDAVSVTSSENHFLGSKFLSPSTGIILNNVMDDFSFPGVVNRFGVPPSASNMLKPGKRPVSSMSPSVVVDQKDRVLAVVGGSGGTKIISAVAQVSNVCVGRVSPGQSQNKR